MPDATVVIVTRNRKEELRKAVASALTQEGAVEVLVIDDGSTDGTADMVLSEFPGVVFHRDEVSRGYIVQRNRAARLASAPIIVSIDDDAAFTSPRTVKQTIAGFDDARIGVVAIPFINVKVNNIVCQRAPDGGGRYVTASFIGTAYAVRKEVFNQLGGFREVFFHKGEEDDFCLRMFAAGFATRLGNADPIHHFLSPKRNLELVDFYGRRNNVLFVWLNVPWPWFLAHLVGTTLNGLWHGFREGRLVAMIKGLMAGYGTIMRAGANRNAVSCKAFRGWRDLRRRGSHPV